MCQKFSKWVGVLAVAVFLGGSTSYAAPLLLNLEPIIGYERVQKLVPTQHTSDRLVYGARFSFGFPLLSLEAEYTRGTDTETFSDPDRSFKDTDDKVKVGARSSLRLSRLLSLQIRGGAQAKQNVHEEILAGNTVKTTSPITYKPYAGAGLTASLGGKIMLSGAVTTVFTDFPHMNKNEYQTTLGFTVRFP